MALDTISDFYAPIFLVQWGLGYSDSFLSNFVSIGQFFVRCVSVNMGKHQYF